MQTIRGRLTVWYSAALVLTLTAFAIVLYVARRRGRPGGHGAVRARGTGARLGGDHGGRRRAALRLAARRPGRAHRRAGGRAAALDTAPDRADRADRRHPRRLLDRARRARAGGPDHQ